MTLVVSFIALVLVFQAYGYNLDLRTGDIIQKGLVIVDARPLPAEVVLNGVTKGLTDRRFFLPADNYTLELRREGYRSWHNEFTIMGGKIRRFVHPFLFPVEMTPVQVQLYAQKPDFTTQSPDRRWLLVKVSNSDFGFLLVDLNSKIASSAALAIPPSVFNQAKGSHRYELVEWSTDNRHLIVKHIFDNGQEFILIDREVPSSSVNLSRVFQSAVFSKITMLDKKFDKYYLYDKVGKTLSTAQLQSTETNIILDNVLDYKTHGDNVILYVTTQNAPESRAMVRLKEGADIYDLRDFALNSSYLLDIARFDGKWYAVVGATSEQKVYVLRDPQIALQRAPSSALIPASTIRLENPKFVSFSANARFIAVQSGSKFAIYDAELANAQRFDADIDLGEDKLAKWMDGHRLTFSAQNVTHVLDFDGTNHQRLVPSYDDQAPFFDSEFTALYTFSEATIEGRTALYRTPLIAENKP